MYVGGTLEFNTVLYDCKSFFSVCWPFNRLCSARYTAQGKKTDDYGMSSTLGLENLAFSAPYQHIYFLACLTDSFGSLKSQIQL